MGRAPSAPRAAPDAVRLPLDEAELGALVAAASGRGATAVRNRALVALLAGSGAKPGEALRLSGRDLALESRRLVLTARDGATREAWLLPAACPHVEAWRRVRALHFAEVHDDADLDAAAFFCTRAGGPLESSYLRRLLPRLARRAKIDRPVNAGLLRATFAAHVYRLGASLSEVQHLLGHGDARSTLHLVQPVLAAAGPGAGGEFRPERWALPGAGGDLRVEVTLRERTPRPAREPEPAPAAAVDEGAAGGQGRTIVRPVRWHEL